MAAYLDAFVGFNHHTAAVRKRIIDISHTHISLCQVSIPMSINIDEENLAHKTYESLNNICKKHVVNPE